MAITTINNRAINRADTAASGQLWTATSATASDFQAAAAGGKIAQVTTGTNNGYDTTSNATSNTDVLSASGTTWETAITPSATSSKILILPAVYIRQHWAGGDDAHVSRCTLLEVGAYMITIIDAIRAINPNAEVRVGGNDVDDIIWLTT